MTEANQTAQSPRARLLRAAEALAGANEGDAAARHMSLAIVGVGYGNRKGPSRRFEIEMCRPGEPVELRPEPKNPADPHAIAVFSARGVQLGYVTAERAPFIGNCMSRAPVEAIFQSSESWGCIIRVSLDGSEPILPPAGTALDPGPDVAGDEDSGFWPDPVYDD